MVKKTKIQRRIVRFLQASIKGEESNKSTFRYSKKR